MKKLSLALLLVFASCFTGTTKQPEPQTVNQQAEVTIRKPDGSTVNMTYAEFVEVKRLADRYVGIQRTLPNIKEHTKIEQVKPHTYKITITLDDSTVITILLNTDSR